LEKVAALSSLSRRQVVCPPSLPGRPSESARAETVMASGELAGVKFEASWALLPAATTMSTPASVAPVMARFVGESIVPGPPRLRLATSMVSAWAVT
jgi:hypothetical protein